MPSGVSVKMKKWKKEQSKRMAIVMNKPKVKAKCRASAIKVWQDPEYQKKLSKVHVERYKVPGVREKQSKIMTERWQEPGYREKAKLKGHCGVYIKSEEHRRILGETTKKNWQNPDYRNKVIEGIKKNWQNPEFQREMAIARNMKPNNLEQFF